MTITWPASARAACRSAPIAQGSSPGLAIFFHT